MIEYHKSFALHKHYVMDSPLLLAVIGQIFKIKIL